MLKKIYQAEFVQSVVTLMTGTVIAQIIAYLVYPFLTRIYSTDEIGELGFYTRLVAFIAAFATARYELALPIAKRDQHAYQLFRLSFRIAFVVLIAVTLVGLAYYLFKPYQLSNFVFVLMTVVSAYIAVWINLGTSWAIRTKEFRKISIQRIVNALSVNSLRLIFGLFSFGSLGLIFATMLGSLFSIFVFVISFGKLKRDNLSFQNKKRMRVMAAEFKQFPKINLPHALLDLGVDLAVSSFILAYYGKSLFGSYSHAYLMLRLPLLVIGQSIGQVFFNKCSSLVNEGKSCYPLLLKTLKTLFLLSIVPFTILFFWGEPIFEVVFGEKWGESGRFASLLAPYLMLNFLVSPVSSLPLVLGRQKEMFLIGILVGLFHLFIYGLLPFLYLVSPTNSVANLPFEMLLKSTMIGLSAILVIVLFLYLQYAKSGRKTIAN